MPNYNWGPCDETDYALNIVEDAARCLEKEYNWNLRHAGFQKLKAVAEHLALTKNCKKLSPPRSIRTVRDLLDRLNVIVKEGKGDWAILTEDLLDITLWDDENTETLYIASIDLAEEGQ